MKQLMFEDDQQFRFEPQRTLGLAVREGRAAPSWTGCGVRRLLIRLKL
ncbi:hypothetical protein [Streptomyces echinatus]